MASINSISNSNYLSSLYNSSNIISGLASGMDTEGMIENLVKSYQNKIQSLTNKATKLEWKQDAYRSIISKMYAFSNKYTSYASSTNLLSQAFFSSAAKTSTLGTYKDSVSASGRTDSDIRLTSVKQLATSARYSTTSSLMGSGGNFSIEAENAVRFTDEVDSGALSGSLTLTYGNQNVTISFDPSTDMIADRVYKTDANGKYVLDENGQRITERIRSADEKAEDLKALIVKKLGQTDIALSSGGVRSAAELIDVSVDGGQISFKDATTGGNAVYISDASSSVKSTLGLNLDNADGTKPKSITIGGQTRLTKTEELGNAISGATMSISLDGKSKTIKLPTVGRTIFGDYNMDADGYVKAVQEALDKEFGAGKIKVTNESKEEGALKLKFQGPEHSDLVINTSAGEALGIGNTATNYLNTSKTLGELLDSDAWGSLTPLKAVGDIYMQNGKRVDEAGNLVNERGNRIDISGNELYSFTINGATIGNYTKDSKLSDIMADINANSTAGVKVSYSQTTGRFTFTSTDTGSQSKIELGNGLARTMFGNTRSENDFFDETYGFELKDDETKRVSFRVNGRAYGFDVTSTTTMEDVVKKLNSSMMASRGYTASYNTASGEILITDQTGKKVDYEIQSDEGELKATYDSNYSTGQDAVFSAEINGEEMIMTRSSNSFSLDGLTLNLKGAFNSDYISNAGNAGFVTNEALKPVGDNIVTFQRGTDADKIVDAVKSMIADYNEMLAEVRSQYTTLPYQNSSGKFQDYEPLSEEDKAGMSESAIEAYEAKAKQGILFGDRNLSTLYDKLRSVFTPGGADEAKLKAMGISITYSSTDGSASVTLDENKLRNMLESDPDAIDTVADMFTRSTSSGASTNGIMQQLKTTLDTYGRTTGAVKGILVEQAGTPLSPLTLMSNTWQKQIDNLGNNISKWQEKMLAQVDRYTSMFSRMETMISQMNSQSSALAGLLGG